MATDVDAVEGVPGPGFRGGIPATRAGLDPGRLQQVIVDRLDSAIVGAVRAAITIADPEDRVIAFSQIAKEISGPSVLNGDAGGAVELSVIRGAVKAFEDFKQTGVGSCHRESWCWPVRQQRERADDAISQLETLQGLTLELSRVSGEAEMRRAVVEGVAETTGASSVELALVSLDGALESCEHYGDLEQELGTTLWARGWSGSARPQEGGSGRLVWTHSDGTTFDGASSNVTDGALDQLIKAVTISLEFNDEIIGVLQLGFGEPRAFPALSRAFVETVGAICSGALGRVRLTGTLTNLRAVADLSQHSLAAVARHIPVGFVLFDAAGNITLINEAANSVFGVPEERLPEIETVGSKALDAFNARWAHNLKPITQEESQIPRALAGEFIRDEEIVVRHPFSGEEVYLKMFAGPIVDAMGGIKGAAAAVMDVTEHHQTLDRLRVSEAETRHRERLYRSLVEASPDGVVFTDLSGNICLANQALASMVASPDSTPLIGQSIQALGLDVEGARIGPPEQAMLAAATQYDRALRQGDGSWRYFDIRSALVPSEGSEAAGIIRVIRDVTAVKQLESDLIRRAETDELTGLPNRLGLENWLSRHTALQPDNCAILLLDLDDFKEVNDTFSHQVGDLLLQAAADRMRLLLRSGDRLSRFGADTFVIAAADTNHVEAEGLARRVMATLADPFLVGEQVVVTQASIGIAMYPDHGRDTATLIRYADIAMHIAKSSRCGVAIFKEENNPYRPERLSLILDLREAVEREQLRVHYQPKVDLATGSVCAVEALVRWQHPVHGLLHPGAFIPLAEATGIIVPMTHEVIRLAVGEAAKSQVTHPEVSVAVNLSARNLADPNLVGHILRLVKEAEMSPSQLKIELTESAVISNPEAALKTLRHLKSEGLRLAIDDFGAGYTSLAYLQRLPLDEVKIDRSFVTDLLENRSNAFIVRSIIDLGHSLGLKVVAEGVETEQVKNVLAVLGCDIVQGLLLGPAVPASELPRLLQNVRRSV
ncbi:MAG TPA: EAL domain-containing protein [Chloroflexota bacterium]|nr:EAL domain-containing protein [Chloroflexota bacterium]